VYLQLHSQACGLKAYVTDVTVEAIEICRRSCGGHGYLMASGICDLYGDALGSCTYEGENTVMYLQTARYDAAYLYRCEQVCRGVNKCVKVCTGVAVYRCVCVAGI
jgi:hypothetical protein